MEILAGAVIGFVVATTGVGTGILTTPALILFFGLPAAASVGTTLNFSTAIKLVATALYVRNRHVDGRVLAWMLAGGVPGALGGALILGRLSDPRLSGIVLCLVGATVVISASISLLRPLYTACKTDSVHALPWFTLPIGLQVGFSSSGAGALGTVLLFGKTRLAPVAVVGTDLAFGLALSAAGGAVHLLAGNWLPQTALKLLAGGLIGVLVGVRLAKVIPAARLRLAVLIWAAASGVWLLRGGLLKLG
jgi:uncharacterized membrane protein YfcA